MNSAQVTLMKKDLRAITSNSRLFSVMLIVPLVMVVVMPTILILVALLAPMNSTNLSALQSLLPISGGDDLPKALVEVLLNNIVTMFFILIPVMASSVMAASSFVGEKERRTLETLLYCPLSLRQIFQAKVLASFVLSMAVSLTSFVIMIVVVEVEAVLLLGGPVLLNVVTWLIVILLISPAISMVAITLTVRGSAKAKTVEESQQRAVFLILPVLLLLVSQFTGALMLNTWLLLALGVVLIAIALWLSRGAIGKFNYETLLR